MKSLIKTTLYILKRRFGRKATLYSLTFGAFNLDTGLEVQTRNKVEIRKCIVLPERGLWKFDYDLTYIAANKNFTYGGQFQVGDRSVIIESSDLPKNWIIKQEDYIVIDAKRYNLVEIWELDEKAGYYLVIRKTQQDPPYQIVDYNFKERLSFLEGIVGEK
jgi:hypothetical protein